MVRQGTHPPGCVVHTLNLPNGDQTTVNWRSNGFCEDQSDIRPSGPGSMKGPIWMLVEGRG